MGFARAQPILRPSSGGVELGKSLLHRARRHRDETFERMIEILHQNNGAGDRCRAQQHRADNDRVARRKQPQLKNSMPSQTWVMMRNGWVNLFAANATCRHVIFTRSPVTGRASARISRWVSVFGAELAGSAGTLRAVAARRIIEHRAICGLSRPHGLDLRIGIASAATRGSPRCRRRTCAVRDRAASGCRPTARLECSRCRIFPWPWQPTDRAQAPPVGNRSHRGLYDRLRRIGRMMLWQYPADQEPEHPAAEDDDESDQAVLAADDIVGMKSI